MAIKALWRIKADKVYEPGEVIAGLSPTQEEELVALGAAKVIHEAPPRGAQPLPSEITALQAVLKTMTKKELLAFGERSGAEVSERMKVDQIVDIILADALEKGVDIEALTDEQLQTFAEAVGVEASGEMSREELLDAVEAYFGELANA